jgi:hypothetical protein
VSAVGADDGSTAEPGLDQHEWESTWASLEEDAGDDPDAALSQLADLVQRMLVSRGYDIVDPVDRTGDEPEVVLSYLSAREVAERAEVAEASRSEVETAIDDLRAVFDTIATERP